ncbi:MAG TPA: hypothetical protein VEY91_05420 [Candidatus Limnocylindria bacterium]|nr:hypothetical protein [Candidatus Limnocylindria bacterium]
MARFQCRHCGTPSALSEPIGREATCDGCGRDLRACVQCRHYDLAYNNACRETMADPVVDKDRRNFCEYFSFNQEPFASPAAKDRSAAARARLEQMFGGQSAAPDRATDARAKLDALFKKPAPED